MYFGEITSSTIADLQSVSRGNELAEEIYPEVLEVEENIFTPIHVVKYRREHVRPRVVIFDEPTPLLTWCENSGVQDAITGGFSVHHTPQLLGEHWVDGVKAEAVQFTAPWDKVRGSLHISEYGHVAIGPRNIFPEAPAGDLMQAAPLLVYGGKVVIEDEKDPEGIAESSHQFDDDWTKDRFPRAAIGLCEDYIWCVATDGYPLPGEEQKNAGLKLTELARFMKNKGAKYALNLDGGSSALIVSGMKSVNKARTGIRQNYTYLPKGREITSAIAFERV